VTLQIYVCRNAKKSEIIRAYRKLAVKWHPDKYEDADKKRAEQMFIDIAAAKEVLSDPGMSVNVSSSVLSLMVNVSVCVNYRLHLNKLQLYN